MSSADIPQKSFFIVGVDGIEIVDELGEGGAEEIGVLEGNVVGYAGEDFHATSTNFTGNANRKDHLQNGKEQFIGVGFELDEDAQETGEGPQKGDTELTNRNAL